MASSPGIGLALMGKRAQHARANAKGRTKGEERFVLLNYTLATSKAFRSLNGTALKYYIELRSRWDGKTNNGKLHLALEDAARLLGMSKSTAHRAQQELVEKGFLKQTRDANWRLHLAAEFALTDKGATGALPSHEYRNWDPP